MDALRDFFLKVFKVGLLAFQCVLGVLGLRLRELVEGGLDVLCAGKSYRTLGELADQ